ncbi:MAG TPA: hypothetical protein VGD10_13045 [Allosphingosinicella sp.]|uniref:hypothetical protein n=1 Tax=Allosphingosinicella sp. TaxID=2823234 RepID=UPI002ED84E99
MRRFPTGFYRAAAVASFLTALTTVALIFLPDFYGPADGLEGRMGRVQDPAYQLRAWIYLFHPLLVFAAALAVFLRFRDRPALVLPGIIGFGLWAVTEAAQQAMTLFMFDRWRRAWLAGDEAIRATMDVRAAIYDGLWDASYVFLLIGFLIGCAFYAAELLRHRRLTRVVGAFYAAAALLTLIFLVADLGGPSLPPSLGAWLYPAIQPLGRFLIGLWLWKNADEASPIAGSSQQRAVNE